MLRNREVRLESLENKLEKLRTILKEKDFKLTEVTCRLTTAELKMKLLEEQIELLEKDLTRGSSSDNLGDAIEVFWLFPSVLVVDNILMFNEHKIIGEKCGNKGEE